MTKMCCVVVMVMVMWVTCMLTAGLDQNPTEPAPGGAVLFFAAHPGMLRDAHFNPMIFTQVIVNQGLGYDPNSGVFTVPVAGVYQFTFSAQLCRGNSNNFWHIQVNGVRRSLCHAQVSGTDTVLTTCFYMDDLKKGDTVTVRQLQDSCAWANSDSRTISFSGVLLAHDGRTALGPGPDHSPGLSCPLVNLRRHVMSGSESLSLPMFSLSIGLFITHCLL
ncbi:complement C1q-like protein 2 [Polymixia lowei]